MKGAFDFTSLKLTHKPNQFLVAPEGLCQKAEPHLISSVYAASPDQTYAAWREILLQASRTELVVDDPDNKAIEAVQRSSLFRFKDRINFAAFAVGEDQCTIAVYSRSLVGYSDMGANKARIRKWLDMLDQALANG